MTPQPLPCPAEDCNDGVTGEYADGFAYCTICDGAGWVEATTPAVALS